MNIYERKSRWKWYLAIVGLVVVLISMVYTRQLAEQLRKSEEMKVELWKNNYEAMTADLAYFNEIMENGTEEEKVAIGNRDVTYSFNNTQIIDDIPLILTGENQLVKAIENYPSFVDEENFVLENKKEAILKQVSQLKSAGRVIEVGSGDSKEYIYYGYSRTMQLLTWFPILQFLLIAGFIAFGYFGLSSSRRAEQNQVWVGMAKETAHQLGTPITAIMGWVDHLKEMYPQDEYMIDVVGELKKDAGRLELIADRFSKIGSEPKMKPVNIYEELEKIHTYMARRASRKIEFQFPDPQQPPLTVQMNPPLFNWVLENLLRNALDAMDGKGTISAKVAQEKDYVRIDISDTGKGIPANKFKTVFKPGYSTKKRGWGLGLSLAKRIIETYHSGRIFVSKSVPGKETTFTIKIPVNHYVKGKSKRYLPD